MRPNTEGVPSAGSSQSLALRPPSYMLRSCLIARNDGGTERKIIGKLANEFRKLASGVPAWNVVDRDGQPRLDVCQRQRRTILTRVPQPSGPQALISCWHNVGRAFVHESPRSPTSPLGEPRQVRSR